MDWLNALTEQVAFINAQVVPWVLRLVMLGLGLTLTLADFRRVVSFPTAAAVGLTSQLVGLPVVAFGLAWLFAPPPAIAVGLVILAACPSGITSNAYAFAARGDVPLCVTLTAVTSVITAFTTPFVTFFALQIFYTDARMPDLPALAMLRGLVLLTLLPVAIGMAIRAVWPALAGRVVEPLRRTIIWLLAAVLVLAAVSSIEVIRANLATAGALVVTMNVLTMAMGYGLARLFRLTAPQVIAVTFEVGVQNLALAWTIAFSILRDPDLAVSALLYAVIMPATALGFLSLAPRILGGRRRV